MELQGQRASLGACIAMGFRRFFPVLGTVLLMSLCIGGVALCTTLPLSMALGGVGALVSLVAILWILSMLYVATQASVIDRPGILAALGRSRDLTRGHKVALSALLVILWLVGFGLRVLVEKVTLPDSIPMYVYASLAHHVFAGSIGAVMVSVAYYFLRAEKEGTSAAELAAVFD